MAMTTYTGWQYLLIDAATHYGHDKMTFEDRIQWTTSNLELLETITEQAETKPLFIKAVMAIRKAQAGLPTGHLVGLDGCCSGIQLMSVMTGCYEGAKATGLVDPDRRADAYSVCTEVMNKILGSNMAIPRADAKEGVMHTFYGSKATPKRLFGEDTVELDAFYEAAQTIAPGAWQLLQALLASWQPYALEHKWTLPDGYQAKVKVMVKEKARIEVDELDHATFTYEFFENQGVEKGLSNAANVVHSVDAYVLRTMHRRCNYNADQVAYLFQCIENEACMRRLRGFDDAQAAEFMTKEVQYFIGHYERSGVADIAIFPHLDQATVSCLSTEHVLALGSIIKGMLQYKPFELVTIHDEFKAHANNMNWVRWQYKEILAELAESNLLDDLLSQIHEMPGTFTKLSNNLGSVIRESAYGLC